MDNRLEEIRRRWWRRWQWLWWWQGRAHWRHSSMESRRDVGANQDGSWEDKKRRGHCRSSIGDKVSERRLQRFCQKDGWGPVNVSERRYRRSPHLSLCLAFWCGRAISIACLWNDRTRSRGGGYRTLNSKHSVKNFLTGSPRQQVLCCSTIREKVRESGVKLGRLEGTGASLLTQDSKIVYGVQTAELGTHGPLWFSLSWAPAVCPGFLLQF